MFVTNSGTAIPIANTLDILGTTIAAGSTPVLTTGATNVVTIEVQASSAQAASSATHMGLASFNSANFTVDANGFVTFAGGGAAETLTGNSGGAVGPTANNINTLGTGSITIVGNPGTSTLTTQLTGLTNHSLLVGAGTATITNLGVATNGQLPIGSTGADPVLATLTSTGGTITITNGAGSINLDLTGGGVAIEKIAVDANTAPGTNPVVPTGGQVTMTGAQVATGTIGANVIRTDSLAANSLTIQIQRSTAVATTDSTKNGVSHFASGHFTVDANGFVDLNGSSVGETITGNSGGALSPTAGNWNILGASTAAGTSPVTTSGAVSTLTVNVQKSQALAATDATKIGLSNFDSASFAVDANGFVTASGTGILKTLTGNSGGAISPTAGNINTLGTGSITIAGAGSTLTTQLTGLTNHNVLVGAGTATITNVAPSATSGVPLVSQGAAADPVFGTAVVAGGGTGATSFNINGVVISNTTTTGALASLTLTNGQVVIGSTGNPPAAATLTAGTGISITNGSNSITIAATGSEVTWTDENTSFSAASGNGYFVTGTATATLPASPSQGDQISFIVDTTNVLTITGNTGQVIRIGSAVSAAAGTAASNARGNSVTLIYRSTGTAWIALSTIGTWTVT